MRAKLWPFVLVFMQFGLILVSILVSDGVNEWWQSFMFWGGIVLGMWAVLTMKLKVSILPIVRTGQKLYISGPYRLIRHPMYTAVLLICAGLLFDRIALADKVVWFVLLGILIVKLQYEEKELQKKFSDYTAYMKNTKRLLPLVY